MHGIGLIVGRNDTLLLFEIFQAEIFAEVKNKKCDDERYDKYQYKYFGFFHVVSWEQDSMGSGMKRSDHLRRFFLAFTAFFAAFFAVRPGLTGAFGFPWGMVLRGRISLPLSRNCA